jgi:hypothetical protein
MRVPKVYQHRTFARHGVHDLHRAYDPRQLVLSQDGFAVRIPFDPRQRHQINFANVVSLTLNEKGAARPLLFKSGRDVQRGLIDS